MVKVLLGFAALSAIAVPGAIYVTKSEIFGLGKTSNEGSKPVENAPGETQSQPRPTTVESGVSSATATPSAEQSPSGPGTGESGSGNQ